MEFNCKPALLREAIVAGYGKAFRQSICYSKPPDLNYCVKTREQCAQAVGDALSASQRLASPGEGKHTKGAIWMFAEEKLSLAEGWDKTFPSSGKPSTAR